MLRFLRTVLLLAIAIFLIALAVANRETVRLVLNPLTPADTAYSLEAPMFLLLFAAIFVGLALGAIGAWMSQGKWRHMARERNQEVHRLREERDRLARRVAAAEEGPRLVIAHQAEAGRR